MAETKHVDEPKTFEEWVNDPNASPKAEEDLKRTAWTAGRRAGIEEVAIACHAGSVACDDCVSFEDQLSFVREMKDNEPK